MAMASSYQAVVADAGAAVITHIGLVNGSGTELSGGSYARQPVTWTRTGGTIRPNANLVFDVPAGSTVAGWRGFTASSGGTNHGGEALTSESYSGAGTYTLNASQTGINHNV